MEELKILGIVKVYSLNCNSAYNHIKISVNSHSHEKSRSGLNFVWFI
ncbi:hypothetical protein M595_4927 [Lyngbya aestuarii BL J]|uniref:Uncharacterized protein n=1 Tax=Lyngbya aestuarii BL J TaxID=1348334 RepID=U7QF98_9CYAN|nr:hypothetical protein M595_4927 [Lyngbya aestuarii BL J]